MGKKKSKDQWITEFNEKWNNFYDYSLIKEDFAWNEKIKIICPIHGEFEQIPNSHLRSGCPKCGKLRTDAANVSRGEKNFFEYAKTQKYDYSKVKYVKSKEEVCIICPEHGEFWQTPNNHMHGQGCPKCGRDSAKNKLIKTTEQFILDAKQVHGDFYDYSKSIYNGAHRKLIVTCPIHGDFETTPKVHVLDKCNCPKCAANKRELDLYNSLRKYFNNIEIRFHYSPEWLNKTSIRYLYSNNQYSNRI